MKRKNDNNEIINFKNILKEASNFTYKIINRKPDLLSFLSIHAPLRKSSHIKKTIDSIITKKCDSVLTVNIETDPVFTMAKNGLNLINPGRLEGLFFEKENLYKFNGSVITMWHKTLESKFLFGKKLFYVEIPIDESFQIKRKEDTKRINN